MARKSSTRAFSLMEVLVVTAILSLLASILLPSLRVARVRARMTKVHAELRSVTMALTMYRQEQRDALPPTRFSCSTRTAYELPIELRRYLPRGRKNNVEIVRLQDPFHPEESYKYRAVGPAILNEDTLLEDAATLWVPDGFPYGQGAEGSYHRNPTTSPARYAVWSMGPDLDSPKFDVPGRLPIPRPYWMMGAWDTGVITHMEDRRGRIHMSP